MTAGNWIFLVAAITILGRAVYMIDKRVQEEFDSRIDWREDP